MSRFITDIAEQTITIEGRTYTANDATASDELPSALQTAMREQYGKDSFMADLSDFLSEWFNGKDTITVYSSGSTGAPKEMQVEKQRMMNSAVMTVSFLDLYRNDTALLCMPLRYIAGKMVVVRALVAGLNLIVVEPCGHPMSKVKEAPAFAALIPMQVYNSMQNTEEKEKLMGIKQLIIGGGPVDEALSKELCDFPNKVWSTYGMTETLSHIALRRLNGKEASEWYTPLEDITVSASQEGALLIDAPQLNAEPLQTNDLVEFNATHQFRILGRKDNIINTGGVKVQIEKVEETLRPVLPYPFIITSAPDAKFGECIVMIMELHPENHDDVHSIIENAIATLPPYWRPKRIITTRSLPLTETGKPDRARAKRIAVDD